MSVKEKERKNQLLRADVLHADALRVDVDNCQDKTKKKKKKRKENSLELHSGCGCVVDADGGEHGWAVVVRLMIQQVRVWT